MKITPAQNLEDIIHEKIMEKLGKGAHQCFHDRKELRILYLHGFKDVTQSPPQNPKQIPFVGYSCTHCGQTTFFNLDDSGVIEELKKLHISLPEEVKFS